MKIVNDFDREKMEIVVNVQCNLLKKYYQNFVGTLEKKKDKMPSGFSVQQSSLDTARISFPIPDGTTVSNSGGIGKFAVNLSTLVGIIENFAGTALRYELEHTEFIPINGYPIENLQKDILESVKNKRNLCVIRSYDEYLKMEKEQKYQFNQVYLNYGTQEWADLVLMIQEGDLDEIRKVYSSKLEFTEWY